MASEMVRGCGYRKVGGLYLVGGFLSISCDRLPYQLESCPICGAGVHLSRAMTEINPLKLFGLHETIRETAFDPKCRDKWRPCDMCDPTEDPAYIMMVSGKFYPTPDDFMSEARILGVSKRIPFVPKHMVLGKTVVYLAHNKACLVMEPPPVVEPLLVLVGHGDNATAAPVRMIDAEKRKYALGVFCVFTPQRMEKIYWQSELDNMAEKEKAELTKRGITPVGIPDGDEDHAK